MSRRHGVLAAILLLAATLRFLGLGWGLRHAPDWDERVFVESAAWMVAERDLDHRFYEYPALFVYALAPVMAFFHPPEVGPAAYLAARGLVAAFSLVSVALTWHLGRRLLGPWGAALAALLVAVNPIEVRTAHEVRPDVVLHTAFLAGLAVFLGRPALRKDRLAGMALAAAAAVKFTGALLVPAYVIHRLRAGDARWGGIAWAGLIALVGFFVLSPYSLLKSERFLDGVLIQIAYHYDGRAKAEGSFAGKLLKEAGLLYDSLGPAAAFLAVAGILVALRRRSWTAVLTLPAVVLCVLATAEVQWPRFLVPILGPLALAAGLGAEAVVGHRKALAAPLLVVAAIPSLLLSVGHVGALTAPTTLDLALDWIDGHVPPGARILTTLPDIGIDRKRHEVLAAPRLDRSTERWAAHMDVIVSGPKDDPEVVAEFEELHDAASAPGRIGAPVRILRARAASRPVYEALRLSRPSLRASENEDLLPALLDGDPATVWRTEGRQTPGESWLEIELPEARTVGRIRLDLGVRRRRFARNLHVLVDRNGAWERVRAFPGRAESEDPPAQEYILDPVLTRRLRLVQVGKRGKHWAVAELVVETPGRASPGAE